jgi:hypothetical protein
LPFAFDLQSHPFITVVCISAVAAQQERFDRASAQREALTLLKELVALDTQNPPGNEILVAKHLDGFLRGVPGIENADPGSR